MWDASVTDIQLSIFENISAEADGVNMLASAGHVEGMRFFIIIVVARLSVISTPSVDRTDRGGSDLRQERYARDTLGL